MATHYNFHLPQITKILLIKSIQMRCIVQYFVNMLICLKVKINAHGAAIH